MQPVNYYSATLVHPSPYLSSVVAVPAMQMNRNSMNTSNKYVQNAVDVAAQMLTLAVTRSTWRLRTRPR